MISPAGNVISFEYQNYGSANNAVRHKSVYVAETTTGVTPTIVTPAFSAITGSNIVEKGIYKIIGGAGNWIEFTASDVERKDYSSLSYPLSKIEIYNSNGVPVKRYKLYTSYFEVNDAEKYDDQINPHPELNYRLRLDSVQEFSGDGTLAKPPYKFIYQGDDDPETNDVYTLPYRLSPSQDHWGYFNNTNNTHTFPGNSSGGTIETDRWYQRFEGSSNSTNIVIGNGANRTPDTVAVRANALKEIYYPTGGHTELIFEANSTSGYNGGLRIKKIVDHPGGNGESKTTIYSYGSDWRHFDPTNYYYDYFKVQYSAWGSSKVDQSLLSLFGLPPETWQDVTGGTREFVRIVSVPLAVLGSGHAPGYGSVVVIQPGNGRVTNTFDNRWNFQDYAGIDDIFDTTDFIISGQFFNSQYITSKYTPETPDGQNSEEYISIYDLPHPVIYGNDWKRGVLTSRITFSENNIRLKEETYEYDRQLLSVIPGYKIVSFNENFSFISAKYYFPNGWIKPKKYVVKIFDETGANPAITTTNYFYDNVAHAQLTRATVTRSDGKSEKTLVTYPHDYATGTAFIDDMRSAHLLAYPIEEVIYQEKNGTVSVLSGRITRYRTGEKGLKDWTLSLHTAEPIPIGSFKFSNRSTGVLPPLEVATTFSPDSRYEQQVTYDRYDNSGNPLQLTDVRAGISRSYIWGYDSQFPIAEIVNAKTIGGGINSTPFDAESPAEMFLTSVEVDHLRSVTIAVDLPPSAVNGTYDEINVRIELTKGTQFIATLTFNFTPVSMHDEETLQLSAGNYSLNYLGEENPGDPDYSFSGAFTYLNTRSTVFHTSFEEDTENVSSDTKTGAQSRPGPYSLMMPPIAGEYIITYWQKSSGGEWTLHQINKTAIANEPDIILGQSGDLIDEVRMYPRGGQMTTYTYDRLNGITSMTDLNSVTSTYEYDKLGRLIVVKDHESNMVKEIGYHYKGN